jgi:hypothetical protein
MANQRDNVVSEERGGSARPGAASPSSERIRDAAAVQETLTGGCACGAVRYELRETPFDTGWCHCRICQRTSGAPAIVFTTVTTAGFSVTRGSPATWRSTEFGTRGLCSTCGSLLTIALDFQPGTIDIAAATLDRPEAVAPGFHVFCGHAIAWARLDDGLPRHDRFRPDTRGLPADQAARRHDR